MYFDSIRSLAEVDINKMATVYTAVSFVDISVFYQ